MNRLFLKSITGEICLFVMHGIKPRAYNPLVLFREECAKDGMIVKKGIMDTLLAVRKIYKNSSIPEHALLDLAIKHREKYEELQKALKEGEPKI